jgi:hypothetical protein
VSAKRDKTRYLLCTALIAPLALGAVHAVAQTERFAIVGEGTLVIDAPAQTSGRFLLKAQLAPPTDVTTLPARQRAERFSLSALLSTSSLVCYNDTIFRDGFDGTGL